MEEYGNLAGLRLNKNKTNILTKNLNKEEMEGLQKEVGLKVINKTKYLGIWITNNTNNLVKDNYIKTWKEIKKELERWENLNLSFSGKIAAIKMSVLPKFLFLFQMLPIVGEKRSICFMEKKFK